MGKPKGYYSSIVLSQEEIKKQSYKQYLGGGEEKWELRGAFQLFFLKKMGMEPFHRMLDIGCGPIRGGAHIIKYLEPGMYSGIDYNKDFILSAKDILEGNPLLAAKNPTLEQDHDFGFSKMQGTFDYILAFSVFNHCSIDQITFFFDGLHRKLKPNGKAYITHATWFRQSMLSSTQLKVNKSFSGPSDISPELSMEEWGWPAEESIFPILELMLDQAS